MIFLTRAIIWEQHAVWSAKLFWLQEKWTKCVNQWHKLTTLEKMVADDCSFGFCLKIDKSFSILETMITIGIFMKKLKFKKD